MKEFKVDVSNETYESLVRLSNDWGVTIDQAATMVVSIQLEKLKKEMDEKK